MKTYHPNWTLKTKALVVFSAVACFFFALGVVFIGKVTIANAFEQRDMKSLLVLILPLAMLIGLSFWVYGNLDLRTKRFILTFDAGFLYFKHEGGLMKREKRIRLADVQSIRTQGHPDYGVSLVIEAGRKSCRLGHLLKLQDALDIESEILTHMRVTMMS